MANPAILYLDVVTEVWTQVLTGNGNEWLVRRPTPSLLNPPFWFFYSALGFRSWAKNAQLRFIGTRDNAEASAFVDALVTDRGRRRLNMGEMKLVPTLSAAYMVNQPALSHVVPRPIFVILPPAGASFPPCMLALFDVVAAWSTDGVAVLVVLLMVLYLLGVNYLGANWDPFYLRLVEVTGFLLAFVLSPALVHHLCFSHRAPPR